MSQANNDDVVIFKFQKNPMDPEQVLQLVKTTLSSLTEKVFFKCISAGEDTGVSFAVVLGIKCFSGGLNFDPLDLLPIISIETAVSRQFGVQSSMRFLPSDIGDSQYGPNRVQSVMLEFFDPTAKF